jgi:N-acetyl-anhydromuramyl-L-alanine amidase AmpD
MNYHAIGIEIVSKTGHDYTDIQRTAVRELVSYLMTLHKIPKENIIRHHDYDPKRKWDV